MKILFISHDASRSGAPLVLLNIIKWLNSNVNNIQVDVLFVKGGDLEADFKKECNQVYFVPKLNNSSKYLKKFYIKVLKKIGKNFKTNVALFYKKLAKNNYEVIYANTVISVPFGAMLKHELPKAKLILHIHELNSMIKIFLPNLKDFNKDIDYYIAVSKPVKDNLIKNWGVNNELVGLIYEFSVKNGKEYKKDNNVFTVGGSGLSYWRKGNDIFLQVARYINKNFPNAKLKFVWVGNEYYDKIKIDADIEKLGLKNIVHFVGEKEHPEEEYKNFDVFLLTSREDPFPLVCIETAKLKKPIICFDKASGTVDIIEKGGGFVVPYLDIEAMGEKIIFYYNNPKKIKKDGGIAYKLFSDYTQERICPLIYQKIQALL